MKLTKIYKWRPGSSFLDLRGRWYGYTYIPSRIRGGFWYENMPYGFYESMEGFQFFIN